MLSHIINVKMHVGINEDQLLNFIQDKPKTANEHDTCLKKVFRRKFKCLVIYAFAIITICQTIILLMERVDFNGLKKRYDDIKDFFHGFDNITKNADQQKLLANLYQ
jgi:hypothetical protein